MLCCQSIPLQCEPWNLCPDQPFDLQTNEITKGDHYERQREPGDFADKKREEQGRGVIVAGPDAHENEKGGKAPGIVAKSHHPKTGSILRPQIELPLP